MQALIETYFSDADCDEITEATRRAETRSAGELVCYVVERCDPYQEIWWKSAAFGGVIAAVAAAAFRDFFGGWGATDHIWVVAALGGGGLFAALVTSLWPALQRWLVGAETLDRRARARAAEAFLEEGIFETRARNGVLIFLGLFEHEVVILADRGIYHAAPTGTWKRLADEVAIMIRSGKPKEAVLHAIEECGALLETYAGPPDQKDDNELTDRPRFRSE